VAPYPSEVVQKSVSWGVVGAPAQGLWGVGSAGSPGPPERLVLAQPCSHYVICQVCPYSPLPWGWVNSSTRGYFFKNITKINFYFVLSLLYNDKVGK